MGHMKQWVVTVKYKSENPIINKKMHVHSGEFKWTISCEDGITAMNTMIERTRNYVPTSAVWTVEESRDYET